MNLMPPPAADATKYVVDLRSDTVTVPTDDMREAMRVADVGDDVYGEDPTVNRLEKLATEMLEKDAAVFVPSGTMANLASVLSHCPRGSKLLVGDESDLYNCEAGGVSALGGVVLHPMRTESDGRLSLDELEQATVDADDPQCARPGLISLETPHNRRGGIPLPIGYLEEVHSLAQTHGLPVHLDGARIFNAACALGTTVGRIARWADSVQFCLSKGLAAPVGSIVVGTCPFIDQVRRARKMLGGGMRQAGVIAAAGVMALQKMVDRLSEDHKNAARLADGLACIRRVVLDRPAVRTNSVHFQIQHDRFSAQMFVTALGDHGVRLGLLGTKSVRAVTHYGICADDVDYALATIRKVLEA